MSLYPLYAKISHVVKYSTNHIIILSFSYHINAYFPYGRPGMYFDFIVEACYDHRDIFTYRYDDRYYIHIFTDTPAYTAAY